MTDATTCPCDFAMHPDHDALLEIEAGGVPALLTLMGELEVTEDRIPWFDMLEFVGQHNWTDPATMWRVARFILDTFQTRGSAQRLALVA